MYFELSANVNIILVSEISYLKLLCCVNAGFQKLFTLMGINYRNEVVKTVVTK